MNETITVKDGQAAVTTTVVSGELSPKSSATDIITVVKTENGDQAAVKVIDLGGGGGGGGDYLPLSGGTLTGRLDAKDIVIDSGHVLLFATGSAFNAMFGIQTYSYGAAGFGVGNFGSFSATMQTNIDGHYYPDSDGTQDFGQNNAKWRILYATKLNNGADLIVPTEGGTLARKEDIDEVVGDISTLLDAINGEVL